MTLGKILLNNKWITEEQLNKALEKQEKFGGLVGTILVDLGYITDKQLIEALVEQRNESCQ